MDAQQRKIIAGNEFAAHHFSVEFHSNTRRNRVAAHHRAKNLVVVPQILIHRIGQCVASVSGAVVPPHAGEQHHALRISNGKQAQDELIDQGEDSCISADPQR